MTLLLAFDTATPQVTVALHDGLDVVAEEVSDRTMKHGEQLAPLIAAVLRRATQPSRGLAALGGTDVAAKAAPRRRGTDS